MPAAPSAPSRSCFRKKSSKHLIVESDSHSTTPARGRAVTFSMGSKAEKAGASKEERGADNPKGGRKARRRYAPVQWILLAGAVLLSCGALWNYAMLDFRTAEGLMSRRTDPNLRRSLLSMLASASSATGNETLSSSDELDPVDQREKSGRGSKYMPLTPTAEGKSSPRAVTTGNVLGRLLDHKLRGQQPAEQGGVLQGQSRGGRKEHGSVAESDAVSAGQNASLPLGNGRKTRSGGTEGTAQNASAKVSGAALKGSLADGSKRGDGAPPRQGALSKLKAFLGAGAKARPATAIDPLSSNTTAAARQSQTAHNGTKAGDTAKSVVVLHNLRHAREKKSDSELRLIEEARKALSEPERAGGFETGPVPGGPGDEDLFSSVDDRWDLLRIQNKLKAEQEYAEYIVKLEAEKARAAAAEAQAEAKGLEGSEGTEERNEGAEERKEGAEEWNAGAQGEGAAEGIDLSEASAQDGGWETGSKAENAVEALVIQESPQGGEQTTTEGHPEEGETSADEGATPEARGPTKEEESSEAGLAGAFESDEFVTALSGEEGALETSAVDREAAKAVE